MNYMTQEIKVSSGAVELTYPITMTETTGKTISSDVVQISLGDFDNPGTWKTPDVISFPTASSVTVQMLINSNVTPGSYYVWVRTIDTPETVPRIGLHLNVVTDTAFTNFGVTPNDVIKLTGVSVNLDAISQATGVIEIVTRVDLTTNTGFDAYDRKWITAAVCYQAAWLTAQPDYFTRSDFMSVSQDGLSVTSRDRNTEMLAPRAKAALLNVSWKGARTVRVAPPRYLRTELPVGQMYVSSAGIPTTIAAYDPSQEYMDDAYGDAA